MAMVFALHGLVRAGQPDNVLTPAEIKEGYTLLFDGNTLASFKANWADYVRGDSTSTNLSTNWKYDATNHVITLPLGNTADVRSTKKYKDFEIRFTYKIDGNQGVFYRSTVQYDRAWFTGVEYAINDVTNLGKDNPGAAYDLYAPPDPVPYNTSSTGKWNDGRITAIGDSIEHWSNGVKVVAYKVHSPGFWATYNVSKWVGTGPKTLTNLVPGTETVGSGWIPEGFLGLQGDHGGRWQIKNLMVTSTPCGFGAVDTATGGVMSSACSATEIAFDKEASAGTHHIKFSALRLASGAISIDFPADEVKSVEVYGFDGKLAARGSLSQNGHKADFVSPLKSGMFFLKVVSSFGVVSEKLNLLQ